jgi:hypothetical protein
MTTATQWTTIRFFSCPVALTFGDGSHGPLLLEGSNSSLSSGQIAWVPVPPPIWELSGKAPNAQEVATANSTTPLCLSSVDLLVSLRRVTQGRRLRGRHGDAL